MGRTKRSGGSVPSDWPSRPLQSLSRTLREHSRGSQRPEPPMFFTFPEDARWNVEEAVLMKPRHRAGKNGVYKAIAHPAPPGTINAGVVNFNRTFAILIDRKLLPLAAQVHVLQNVVEYLMKTQLRSGTAASGGEVRQDKLFERREIQLRRNRLPALIFCHSGPPENGTLLDSLTSTENPGPRRLTANFGRLQKPATTCRTRVDGGISGQSLGWLGDR